jgi:hypothetical protein
MKKKLIKISLLLSVFIIAGCNSDNNPLQVVEEQYTLIYERPGVIDSVYGDCSGTIVRTNFLDEFDFSNTNSIKFEFDTMTDADMSSFEIFHSENGINHILISLNADQMNNLSSVIVNNPDFHAELKTRITLNSSVCTGQIFYARVKNVRIYVN